jgi:hypothetical protein|tara:strand:- start:111 stop:287 length:177 start_codon:yes stop_codon:yes gene_type:complete
LILVYLDRYTISEIILAQKEDDNQLITFAKSEDPTKITGYNLFLIQFFSLTSRVVDLT